VNDRGSALLLAVFVLAVLTGMGMALHFLAQSELIMSAADRQTQQTYFLAEAGIEAGRQQLFATNGIGSFDDDLVDAAGADGIIDFDPDALQAVYSGDGTVSGFTGYGDDRPLVDISPLGTGWYAAFLTDDPANTGGTGSTNDDNDRVMITAVGAGRRGALEIVQAIVEPSTIFPADLPATITMFGDNPTFDDTDDADKVFQGDDCGGAGIPSFSVPVAGLIGTPAESVVESGLSANTVYTSAGNAGHETVADLTDPTDPGIVASSLGVIDPSWIDCEGLRSVGEEVRSLADVICLEGSPCTLPASSPDRIVFVDGDFTLNPGDSGAGLLWATGRLTVNGSTDWTGIIMVVGEGEFVWLGGGTGKISGAIMVADIAGPDNGYGNADDCTGGSAGFAPAVFDESSGGTGPTEYCNADVLAATPITRYAVVEFRQR
jgi:hypothetical protein